MRDAIVFDRVSLTLGKTTILRDFDFSVKAGEIKVIMGPSGSGKTSLLRLTAGLIKPDKGRIITDSHKIAMQFQEPRLLPWFTALENVNLVMSDTKDTLDEARAYLSLVGLEDAADLYPMELSGGMQQRVALARTLAYDADIILLDEPFRGLDQSLKQKMIDLVKFMQREASILLVTHDAEVADAFGGVDVQFPMG